MRCHVSQCPPASLGVIGKGGTISQELKIAIGSLEIFKADLLQAFPNFLCGHGAFKKEGDLVPLGYGRWRLLLTQKGVVDAANRVGVCSVVSQEVFNRLGTSPAPTTGGRCWSRCSTVRRNTYALTRVVQSSSER